MTIVRTLRWQDADERACWYTWIRPGGLLHRAGVVKLSEADATRHLVDGVSNTLPAAADENGVCEWGQEPWQPAQHGGFAYFFSEDPRTPDPRDCVFEIDTDEESLRKFMEESQQRQHILCESRPYRLSIRLRALACELLHDCMSDQRARISAGGAQVTWRCSWRRWASTLHGTVKAQPQRPAPDGLFT
jgi:hypothetical protein